MKILILSSEVLPERAGGIATYVSTIAPALARRGHEVHVLSCAPEHGSRDELLGGVWWHRRPLIASERVAASEHYKQASLRLATAWTCRKEVRSMGTSFDVVESPEWIAESLFLGIMSRIPVVAHLHTPLRVLFSYDVDRGDHRDLGLADRFEKWAVARAKAVTSTSALLARRLRDEGWLRQEAEIIRYPVDLTSWPYDSTTETTRPNVLVVGRLEPRKAQEVAVEAAAILAPEVPGLEMTFVGRSRAFLRGGKPYGDWLAELAEQKGAPVRFVPQIPNNELQPYYAAARVVAVPSRFESFSIAALEAMATGRPVVYTSRVGAGEVLREGDAGAEVPPEDPQALADALRPFLVNPSLAAKAGRVARELVETQCDPDSIAAQRERCYENAIVRRR